MKTSKAILVAVGILGSVGFLRAQAPGISLTSVPVMGSNSSLSGLVVNAPPASHRVAVYIFVQGWWSKPFDAAPLTVIQSDGSWSCNITTGGADAYATRLAAYLVPQSYSPPLLHGAATLSAELDTQSLAKVITERPSLNSFHWCGYDWDVKASGPFAFGPGPNLFSDSAENVWVDSNGKLHLRITYRNGQWYCAEVVSSRQFGYGTYRFFLDSVVDALDPNVVLGLFTYDDDPTGTSGHREIDVEVSRWGNAADTANSQYVIQPFDLAGNLTRWTIPTGASPTTHSFKWSNARVEFASHHGTYTPPPASVPQIASWSNSGASVPSPGSEHVRMNLWLFNGSAPMNNQEVEVIIERFAFIPLQPVAPRTRSVSLDGAAVFHLALTGDPQVLYRLEISGNLATWTALDTRTAPESDFEFSDADAGAETQRFYRVVVPQPQ